MQHNAQQYARAWFSLLSAAPPDTWNVISTQVLAHMHRSGKIALRYDVVQEMERMYEQHEDVQKVTLRFAHKLEESIINAVVKKVIGGRVAIEKTIDEDVLGGVTIETRNKRWDLSARGGMRALKKHLHVNA